MWICFTMYWKSRVSCTPLSASESDLLQLMLLSVVRYPIPGTNLLKSSSCKWDIVPRSSKPKCTSVFISVLSACAWLPLPVTRARSSSELGSLLWAVTRPQRPFRSTCWLRLKEQHNCDWHAQDRFRREISPFNNPSLRRVCKHRL